MERSIHGGEVYSCALEAAAGHPVWIAVQQRGIDVVLEAFGPDGRSLALTDSPSYRSGREVLLLEPTESGTYRIEVRPSARAASPGRYEIQREDLSEAGPENPRRLEAERLRQRAVRLYPEETPAARREAAGYYEQALPIWRALGSKRDEAETLACAGEIYRMLGEDRRALERFGASLPLWEALGEEDRRADVLNLSGLAYGSLGENPRALEVYGQALAIRRARGDRFGEATELNNIALIHYGRGELREALAGFEAALERVAEAGDPELESATLLNLGALHGSLGAPRRAVSFYKRALPLARTLGSQETEARIYTSLAVSYRVLGDLGLALSDYGKALEIQRRIGDRAAEARTLQNLGLAYSLLGEPERALPLFEEAIAVAQAIQDRRAEAAALTGLAGAEKQMDHSLQARGHYARAVTLARAVEDRSAEAAALTQLGDLEIRLGHPKAAHEPLARAAELQRAAGNRLGLAMALLRLGRIQRSSRDFPAAVSGLEQALGISREVGARMLEAEALEALAGTERDLGAPERAWTLVEEALAVVESLRSTVVHPDLRASYLASRQEAFELAVDLRMDLERREPGRGHARTALAASERSRARSFLDLLQEAHAEIRQGIDPALAERESDLRQRLNVLALKRTELLAGSSAGPESKRMVEESLAALLADLERVESEIRLRSPRYAALTHPRPLDAGEIQALLAPDTLLLEYFLGERRSHLWVVGPGAVTAFELPGRKAIEDAAREVYQRLRVLTVGEAGPGGAAALSRMILGPAAGLLGRKRLVVVADGALQYVPFAALPDPASARELLLERHEIVSLPSASVLALQRRELAGRPRAAKQIAVFADPVFSRQDPRVAGAGRATPPGSGDRTRSALFDRLPATRREAEGILSLVPAGQALAALDFQASRQTVLTAGLGGYRIVHFATHGLIDARAPQLSGLVLSQVDPAGRPLEGFLGLRDIFNLQLDADLVALSACDTALGKNVRGEGLTGLTRAFLYAGASAVMASLWRVQDRATAELMKRFYRAILVDGLSPAAALRQAQLSLRSEPRWRSPYFWAPFVLQGDWR